MGEFDIVEKIREKTEEEDINSILKTAFIGGYSKKSVMEYLAETRKKQQSIKDTFNSNIQSVFEEKERLKSENETLSLRLEKSESDYKTLSEAINIYKLDDSEYTLNDVMTFKINIETLKKEKQDLESALVLKDQEIERLEFIAKEEEEKTDRAEREIDILNEQIILAKSETMDKAKKSSELSRALLEAKNEVKFLREVVSDGNISKLNDRINELVITSGKQGSIIKEKNIRISDFEQKIKVLEERAEALKSVSEKLSLTLDELMLQDSKKDAAIDALEERLRSELERSLELIKSRSGAILDKSILERKLEALKLKNETEKLENATDDASEGI